MLLTPVNIEIDTSNILRSILMVVAANAELLKMFLFSIMLLEI